MMIVMLTAILCNLDRTTACKKYSSSVVCHQYYLVSMLDLIICDHHWLQLSQETPKWVSSIGRSMVYSYYTHEQPNSKMKFRSKSLNAHKEWCGWFAPRKHYMTVSSLTRRRQKKSKHCLRTHRSRTLMVKQWKFFLLLSLIGSMTYVEDTYELTFACFNYEKKR